MIVNIKIKADEYKLLNLLNKFSKSYHIKFGLARLNGDFNLTIKNVAENDFGELIRRLKISNFKFSIKGVEN